MSDFPIVFDRQQLGLRRKRALAMATQGADFLLRMVVDDLIERLGTVNRSFDVAVDLGGFTEHCANALEKSDKCRRVIRADGLIVGGATAPDLVADEEYLPFKPQSLDLIVSALTLQFVNDLPGALHQIRHGLKPDGLFLAALAGGDTLSELREAFARAEAEISGGISPRVMPAISVRDIGGLLHRAGFALPVTDRDRLTVRYDTMFDLMRDLRAFGATNMLSDRRKSPLPRRVLMRAAEIYSRQFADADGRIRASFEIISLSGWAPHESQQQPLKPGSAKHSLADALTKFPASGEE